MSAFYDLASLVLVPSGYKASKVYAQKPLTTDGQLTFSRASTATRVNASGLIETVSSNVPRLDYLGSTCPKLQLEPQRSNLALHNSDFDNAVWNKGNASVSANQAVSPDGATNADKLIENSSSSFHDTNQQSIIYTAAAHTISVFAKAAGRNHIFLQIFDGVTFYTSGTFNLSNGTVSGSGSIVSYGNGWYRCSFTATTASGSGGAYINLSNGTTGNYTGNGTSGVFVYGAQVEAGAYATSYIPTLGASVTRLADSSLNFSALVNNTSFTLFFEGSYSRNDSDFFDLLVGVNGFSGNYFSFYNGFIAIYNAGGGVQTFGTRLAPNTVHKLLIKYDGTTAKYYRNGELFLSIPATGLGTFADGYIYNNDDEGLKVKQLLYFPSALTDAQCIELTTL